MTNSLATRRPDIAAQWHPTRNGPLTPRDVTVSAGRRVWWKCPRGPDHEWRVPVEQRRNRRCPFCSGKRASITNSLASLRPALAREWHRTKNRPLTPRDVVAGSHRLVWWKCPKGPDHVWQAVVKDRAKGSGCPYCAHKRVSVTTSLAGLFPKVAREWHPTRNGALTPAQVLASGNRYHWWLCPRGHAWQARPRDRTVLGRCCPVCAEKLARA